jgi:hypothetical protein
VTTMIGGGLEGLRFGVRGLEFGVRGSVFCLLPSRGCGPSQPFVGRKFGTL